MIIDAVIGLQPFTTGILVEFAIFLLLIASSALISGSEIAFFSLEPADLTAFRESENKKERLVIKLLEDPNKLLATILISNNFVNIGIVILSTFIISGLFVFQSELVQFVFEAVIVTFLILLFGEIIPKVYANSFNKSFALFMVYPMSILQKLFSPLSWFLMSVSSLVQKLFPQRTNLSLEDISKAIEITDGVSEEKQILKEIVKFGNVDVKEIMTPRVDVVALKYSLTFWQVKEIIAESGYSRYPVYGEKLDEIKGILVAKDLIAFLNEGESFGWQKYIREPYFVPETKKIDDLLEEFRQKKIHMAIVIDEYGGFSGIITLEDIMEEIVGEIVDENDEEDLGYKILGKGEYQFDGKFLIKDFYRVFGLDDEIFDKVKGDAETLAGLLLELKGDFPEKGEKFRYDGFEFEVLEVDERHIVSVKVKLTKN